MQQLLSKTLYRYRKIHNLTQETVAERLGISVRWYQMLESGRKLPGTILMLNLVAYLGIDGKELRISGQQYPD